MFLLLKNLNHAELEEHEETLTCEAKYTCPKCKHEGEASMPFKRKNIKVFDEEKQKKVSVSAVPFNCEKCEEQILITKKMK